MTKDSKDVVSPYLGGPRIAHGKKGWFCLEKRKFKKAGISCEDLLEEITGECWLFESRHNVP